MKKLWTKVLAVCAAGVLAFGAFEGANFMNKKDDGKRADIIEKLITAQAEQIDAGDNHAFVGLSDISAVGVNSQRFYGEEILTVNEADFDVVIDGAQYGIVADDKKDDSAAVANAVAAAKEAGANGASVLLKLPEGELDFVEGFNPANRTCAIELSGVKNVVILGNNTMLTIHGVIDGILVDKCENIAIKGVSYDYGRTPFSVGTVVSSTEKSVTVKFRDNYPIAQNTNFNDYLEFDKYAYVPRSNGNFLLSSDIKDWVIDGQTVTFNFYSAINTPPKDTLVVTSHYTYGYEAVYMTDCKDVTLENINVYTAAGMGIVGLTCENLRINRVNVCLKPKTDRLMSTTADGMHFGACRGELTVTNCLIENTHDDACNVKAGHYFGVSNIDRVNNVFKCVKLNYMHEIKAGDVIDVYAEDLQLLAKIELEKIISVDGTGTVVKAKEVLPEALTENTIVANASTAPEFTFENNVIRNKRNRGVLMQTRNAIVKNNAFINVGHGAISIMTEAAQFNEAIVPENVVIESNKIIGCNGMGSNVGGDIAIGAYGKNWIAPPAGTIKNVTIKNNFVANTAKRAININSAGQTKVVNNLIYNPARNPLTIQNDCAIALSVSNEITINENYVSNNSASVNYVSLFTDGTVAESEVELKDNVGVAFATVDISVKPDDVKKLASGTVIDMTTENLDDFAGVEETINFVGYTDAYGKEVRPTADNFTIKSFKVTYDDKGLYIAFDVKDDIVEFASSSSFWTGDGFELFITPATEENYAFPIIRQTYNDTAQLYITSNYMHVEESRTSRYLMENKATAFTYKCWATSEGYAGKLFINFDVCKEIKQIAADGGVISCSFVLADMETGKDRLQISNTAHNVENNKGIPVAMGKIHFA